MQKNAPSLKAVETSNAPKPRGPYSQAVLAGSYLFIAGQIPIDTQTGALISGDIRAQTHQVINHIEAILKTLHLNLSHVVKTDVFLIDLQEFQAMNEVYAERFSYPIKPARITIEASKLPMDARIEISCIAFY